MKDVQDTMLIYVLPFVYLAMLGFILWYFMGKAYYDLAIEHEKTNAWMYAVLAVLIYYSGAFAFGLGLGVVFLYTGGDIDEMSDLALSLAGLPFGLLAVWGIYRLLKARWSQVVPSDVELLDEEI
ncbi:MAG: hypothetical protein H6608_04705 [Flavobacteriales bacterium]|nr:hypothetical protein [Bacteroidota bacterium]MCB9240403.1 hypothetical protein [Flavobacteriales bacterium]